jgi:hypothetical protein
VRDFVLYVLDDRSTVPTLIMVSAANDVRAKAIAKAKLDESPHHLAVDVTENGETLILFERLK